MKYWKRQSIAALFAVAIFVFGSAAAFAGDVYENEIDADTDLLAAEITDEDLRAFVQAAKAVQEVRAFYAPLIRKAGDEWYEELRAEALGRMVAAIRNAGLDPETYRGIAYHVNRDKELLSRIY